ncbi:uncharacterized protein LOC143550388 [Bidens hawaiensis]|uniref:uncharacterized protein LOC143550388 n=1 Tax=Bidens hawaiensis TaxID=980011 RepID=UPI00404A5699
MEKLVLALIYTARKLRRYFQAHVIHVLTNQPLQLVSSKPKVLGRLAKWAIELGDHTIEYKPRVAFKGQVVADFLTETGTEEGEEEKEREKVIAPEIIKMKEAASEEPLWNLHTDEASNEEGSGAGVILVSLESIELTYAVRLDFPSTNNEAEYEALLAGLRMAQRVKAKRIKAHVDSLLVVNQVKGSYETKDPKMVETLIKAQELLQKFEGSEVLHIPRSLNKKLDALCKLVAVAFNHLAREVKVEVLRHLSIAEIVVASTEVSKGNWMTPFLLYFQEEIIPDDKETHEN